MGGSPKLNNFWPINLILNRENFRWVVLSLCMYTQLHTFTSAIYTEKMSGYQCSYREQWLQKLKRLGKTKPRWVDNNPPGSRKTEVVSKCSTPFSHIYMFRVVIHIIREQPQFETVEDT